MIEDENTEFKEIVVDEFKKEVVAFANTRVKAHLLFLPPTNKSEG